MKRIFASTATILLGILRLSSTGVEPGATLSSASMVVTNAHVITVDSNSPLAEAFAIQSGRFIAVGSLDQVLPRIGPETTILNAQGKTITPGFIDAHIHPRPLYPPDSPHGTLNLGPDEVKTLGDLIQVLEAKAKTTAPGQWIIGRGYQDTKLGRHPRRQDLDRASKVHPIMIRHSSGHISVVNSYALEMAGIDANSVDPPGGSFDRDAQGVPNGICRERAGGVVSRAGPTRPDPSLEDQLAGLQRQFLAYLSNGITSIQVAGTSPSTLDLYKLAQKNGEAIRVYVMLRERYLERLAELREEEIWDDRLKVGAIKLFHGNSLSGRTCWLYEPYADQPNYYGIPPARTQEDLDRLISDIHEMGFQAAVHSNGDREIDMVLDAFEKALRKFPRRDHRHRIEHCSVVNPGILERIKKLGIVLALHSYVYEHGDTMEAYGQARWGMMHANRSALELGIPVAGNSDSPVSAAVPMLRIQSMVTRTTAEGKVYGPEQRVPVDQAIAVWTLGGAYASFDEKLKGSIEEGKLADFVILSEDLRQVDPFQIKDIRVEKTFIGGELVYPW